MDRKRYTLLVTCYNFERFIRETVRAALAQTYEPLDIIFSDDCSADRSWEIITEEVAAYKGPHHIILNRNETNLGFAANLNKSYALARTDWVINQSGDDISLPMRVERYVEVIESNPRLRCVGSWYEVIDGNGLVKPTPKEWSQLDSRTANKRLIPMVIGVVAAYHMDVFRVFGPMSAQVWNEDSVLPFRARLIGEIGWVDEVLVQYRFHDANMSGGTAGDRRLRIAGYTNRRQPAIYQQLIDLYVAEKIMPDCGRKFLKMRRFLEREVYIKWFVSNWVLHPGWRWTLLWDLFLRPAHLWTVGLKIVTKTMERVCRLLSCRSLM